MTNQKCGASNCLQCPLVNTSATATINGLQVKTAKTLNCKSRNVIYLWQCQICENDNSYFGRTIQKSHERTNTHRRCFSEEKWKDSELSMHSHNNHEEQFNLENFKTTLVKKCSPQRIAQPRVCTIFTLVPLPLLPLRRRLWSVPNQKASTHLK